MGQCIGLPTYDIEDNNNDHDQYTQHLRTIIPIFVRECCQLEYGKHVTGDELYEAYKAFERTYEVRCKPVNLPKIYILHSICRGNLDKSVKTMVITSSPGEYIVINMQMKT